MSATCCYGCSSLLVHDAERLRVRVSDWDGQTPCAFMTDAFFTWKRIKRWVALSVLFAYICQIGNLQRKIFAISRGTHSNPDGDQESKLIMDMRWLFPSPRSLSESTTSISVDDEAVVRALATNTGTSIDDDYITIPSLNSDEIGDEFSSGDGSSDQGEEESSSLNMVESQHGPSVHLGLNQFHHQFQDEKLGVSEDEISLQQPEHHPSEMSSSAQLSKLWHPPQQKIQNRWSLAAQSKWTKRFSKISPFLSIHSEGESSDKQLRLEIARDFAERHRTIHSDVSAAKPVIIRAAVDKERVKSALEHALLTFSQSKLAEIKKRSLERVQSTSRQPKNKLETMYGNKISEEAESEELSGMSVRKVSWPGKSSGLALGDVVPHDEERYQQYIEQLQNQDRMHAVRKARKDADYGLLAQPLPNHTCSVAGRDVTLPEFPTFIIAGTQKGGTSALFVFLNEHPSITSSTK
jgi:hypothetical protein